MQNVVMVTPVLNTSIGIVIVQDKDGLVLPTKQLDPKEIPIFAAVKLFKTLFPSQDFNWWQERLGTNALYVDGYGANRNWTHVLRFDLSLDDLNLADQQALGAHVFLSQDMHTTVKDFVVAKQREYVEDIFSALPNVKEDMDEVSADMGV